MLTFYQRGIKYSPDSGHGGQTKDVNGDEGDGYDEGDPLSHRVDPWLTGGLSVIYPVDFKKAGHIVDDVKQIMDGAIYHGLISP